MAPISPAGGYVLSRGWRLKVQLNLKIRAQPDSATCGPTCLHALYGYHGERIPLEQVIAEVPSLPTGGTLGVMLACHALRRGYRARIYSYNLQLFDPTWFGAGATSLAERLIAQRACKSDPRLHAATAAYLDFLELGGEVRFQDLSKRLMRQYLNDGRPILTGLSATYLYRCSREFGTPSDYDDVRGEPTGHFVVLSGYDRVGRTVSIADPLRPNPLSDSRYYEAPIDRVLGAILLGIVTYDANLLIIEPR
jgi:hypothetical protein